ncbi:arginine N-succinyltransferase [uncultured Sphingomonas sp.]|uniref:arginine N-succinyltransferase n=1 Tax=uncultured Sphingomonas sp. TaxID=158754 RepID=UPI0025DB13D0|nr:arginine N-succinyltransferase [uncultured Sphingomonas sp.]
MTAIVRPARPDDLESLYEMAKLAGNGFTNLPADRTALAAKLARSDDALSLETAASGDHLYVLMLEDLDSGRIAGTAQIMARVGDKRPFYSYRRGVLTQHSAELGRSFRAEMLTLTTDLEGSSEVGGLFLHPRFRAGGLGLLLARSRYLFIRQHRARFCDRLLAELRGVIDETGVAPFWDGLAGPFFGMSFREADAFNAVNGHQFIADLMPKHPIYLAMLPDSARAVIGVPHPTGRPAMRMLEAEGFASQGYVDIFDGGPTLSAPTDHVRTIRDAGETVIDAVGCARPTKALVSAGTLRDFRAALGEASYEDGRFHLAAACAETLGVTAGDTVLHVAR